MLLDYSGIIYARDFSDHANWIVQTEISKRLLLEKRIPYLMWVLDLYMPTKLRHGVNFCILETKIHAVV